MCSSDLQLGGDYAVLRRIKLEEGAEPSRTDDFSMKVHEKEIRRIRIRQKAGIHFEPELGDALGERPGAGGMRARLFFEPLDPLDQGGFTWALADPSE